MKDDPFNVGKDLNDIDKWIELLLPTSATVLAWYDHPYWGKYVAVTQNSFGKGTATYIVCGTKTMLLHNKFLKMHLKRQDFGEKIRL